MNFFLLKYKKYGIAILVIIIICVAFIVVKNSKNNKTKQELLTPITVSKAELRNVPVEINATGSVEAYNSVTIIPQVTGKVSEINFKQGQAVKAGDRLLTIDTASYEQALAQAEAELKQSKAQANYNQATAKRYANLYKKGAVALQDYDQVNTAASTQNATVSQMEAAVKNARINLNNCYITSPINGCTGAFLANIGTMATANQTQLLVINQIVPIYVKFTIPEKYFDEVREAQKNAPLQVVINNSNSQKIISSGTLSFIDNTVDQASGAIGMKATFTNTEQQLWPGEFVRITLKIREQPNAVVIPKTAVMDGQNGKYVFVVNQNNIVKMKLVTEDREVNGLAVISKGINAGETVATDGQTNLVSGTKVAIQSE